jgi:hypothetical protein
MSSLIAAFPGDSAAMVVEAKVGRLRFLPLQPHSPTIILAALIPPIVDIQKEPTMSSAMKLSRLCRQGNFPASGAHESPVDHIARSLSERRKEPTCSSPEEPGRTLR